MNSPAMKSSNNITPSPRARAHQLKAMNTFPTKSMPKKIKKKKKGGGAFPKPEMFLYESSNDDLSTIRSIYMDESVASVQNSVAGSRSKIGEADDISRLQNRLSQSMEESDLLRNRLRLEHQEKQNLEVKVNELTEKLVEAKKGLQETSLALHKVQMATNQLMSKRDQREVDLQMATEQNRIHERKIAELEGKLLHMEGLSNAKQSVSQHSEKMLAEKITLIQNLDVENDLLRRELGQVKRDSIRTKEEKHELEYVLEAKKKRIITLEEHVKSLEIQQQQSLELMATNRDAYYNSVVTSFDAVATRMNASPPRPTTRKGRSDSPTPSVPYEDPAFSPGAVDSPQQQLGQAVSIQLPHVVQSNGLDNSTVSQLASVVQQAMQSVLAQQQQQLQQLQQQQQQQQAAQVPPPVAVVPTVVPVVDPAPVAPAIDKAEMDQINKKLSELSTMENKLSTLQTDKSSLEGRLSQLEQMLHQQHTQQQQMHEQQSMTIQTLNQSLVASLQREQAIASAAANVNVRAQQPPILSRGANSKPNSANAVNRSTAVGGGNRPVSATGPIVMGGAGTGTVTGASNPHNSFANMFYNGEQPSSAGGQSSKPSSAASNTPLRVATPLEEVGTRATSSANTNTTATVAVAPTTSVITVPTTAGANSNNSTNNSNNNSNPSSRPITGGSTKHVMIVVPEGESLDMITSRAHSANSTQSTAAAQNNVVSASLNTAIQAYHTGTLNTLEAPLPLAVALNTNGTTSASASSKPSSAAGPTNHMPLGTASMSFSEPVVVSNGPSRVNTASARASSADSRTSGTSAESISNEDMRKKINEERRDVKKQILAWNKKFIEDNKREASKQEREKNIGTLYRRYRQNTKLLKELELAGGGKSTNNNDNEDADD